MFLFFLAVFPPILIAYYVYRKDKYEKEPDILIIKSFLFGCFSVLPIVMLEELFNENFFSDLFLYAMLGVALIEEGMKYFFLKRYLYNKPDFNEPFDGIVYAVMISLGFATIENIGYVYGYEGQEIQVAIIRMFTAIPLHAICGILMGYYVGLAKFNPDNKKLLLKGLCVAIFVHGIYDYFLFSDQGFLIWPVLVIGIYYSRKAIRKHQENSPFKG